MIETELLKKKISESGYKMNWIAKSLGLTAFGLRKKINGETEFKVSELKKISEILKIEPIEMKKIFF